MISLVIVQEFVSMCVCVCVSVCVCGADNESSGVH